MANDLKELRLRYQILAKDIVATVQTIYPKYDKTMQSKCERGDEYGIELKPDAMELVLGKYAPEALAARKRKKNGGHRLTCRISCRLEDSDYRSLQQYIKDNGYNTIQAWLTDMVRQYINK